MIGHDTVERAVLQSLFDRRDILCLADGRVDLCVRVVAENHIVRERKVMRAGLRRNGYPARLRLAQELNAALRGNVADVHVLAQRFRQNNFAGDHHLFRRARNPL